MKAGIKKLFNYYDYINHYGTRMFAIAATDAMPARFNSVLFTGHTGNA